MSPKSRQFALDTTRDLLKLNGAGAIATFAVSPNFSELHPLVVIGGVAFVVGVLDSLWAIRKIMAAERMSDQHTQDVEITTDFGGIVFAAALCLCTVGAIATFFAETSWTISDSSSAPFQKENHK